MSVSADEVSAHGDEDRCLKDYPSRPHHGELRGHADGAARRWLLVQGEGLHSAFWFLAALLARVLIFGRCVAVENPH
jgi:hypothetical protein